MKHLFVARHGNYCRYPETLTETGRTQIIALASSVREVLNSGSAYIISSTAPRAKASSRTLAAELGQDGFEEIPFLWSGLGCPAEGYNEYDPESNGKVQAIVDKRRDSADGLIIMTHLEVAESFSPYFHEKEFGTKRHIQFPEKGQAVYFDLGGKTYRMLP